MVNGEPLRRKCAPADGLRTETTTRSTGEDELMVAVEATTTMMMEVAQVAMKVRAPAVEALQTVVEICPRGHLR